MRPPIKGPITMPIAYDTPSLPSASARPVIKQNRFKSIYKPSGLSCPPHAYHGLISFMKQIRCMSIAFFSPWMGCKFFTGSPQSFKIFQNFLIGSEMYLVLRCMSIQMAGQVNSNKGCWLINILTFLIWDICYNHLWSWKNL